MAELGIQLLMAFMASLLVGGLFAWSWTFYRLIKRLPVFPPEPRLPINWGLAEVLMTLGVYILATTILGVAALFAGVQFTEQIPTSSEQDLAQTVQKSATSEPLSPQAEPSAETETADSEAGSLAISDSETESTTDRPPPPPHQSAERIGAFLTIDATARLVTIAVVLGLLSLFDRKIIRRMGWIPKRRDFRLGVVAACMLLPLLFLFQSVLNYYVPYEHSVLDVISQQPPQWVLLAMAFTSVIAAPLAEEFFFRGMLQGGLQRIANAGLDRQIAAEQQSNLPADTSADLAEEPLAPRRDWNQIVTSNQVAQWPFWPILVSSLFFALVHFGQGAAPISLFFFSLGLGLLYHLTGRLWASITVHAMLNAISTAMAILSV
ncbi:CAAX amino terminal protease self- immunity [Roseimaritima multifibrata]|uniref:CAAX amino terminal protease self-immunity n=1 Tax=Roseimaritima multifibrata TaxID=1930274 RepID=A0A517MJS8_9BACT|nr:CPBP family intramembrane glutamic endopeptidase [Roseimaritima multifibrata]QDS95037.1 CAAX amino terminal protease self- immunity [Roseimaritima multifibrata]